MAEEHILKLSLLENGLDFIIIGYEWEEEWCEDCHDEIRRLVERDD